MPVLWGVQVTRRTRFRPRLTLAPRYDHSPVPGLPSGAMVITNTERKDLFCPRRWWYSRGLRLQSNPNSAMRFGSAFDRTMEGILEWYRLRPDATSITWDEVQDGPLRPVLEDLLEREAEYPDGVDQEIERLQRAVQGWVVQYGRSMAEDFQVLDSQPMLAVPITSPTTGKVYRSKVPVVRTGEGWRTATAHDAHTDVSLVTLPWFQLVKLDGVVLHRAEQSVWAWETKTTANPQGYSRALHLDTQLPGYTRALWYATQVLGLYGGRPVGGYVWDVTSSQHHRDPKVLSSGKVSMAAGQRVPSWRWRRHLDTLLGTRTLQEVQETASRHRTLLATLEGAAKARAAEAKSAGRGAAGALARAERDKAQEAAKVARVKLRELQTILDVESMIQVATETVDPNLYLRRWGEFTTHTLAQYEVELFRDAVRVGENLRRAVGTSGAIPSGSPDSTTPTDLDLQVSLHFPRVPVCRQPGGFCPYTGPCLQDGDVVRSNYQSRDTVHWLDNQAAQDHSWASEA